MCRIPTRTSNKAARRAGVSGPLPNAVFGLGAIPVDEFAMAWDQAAALPVCDLLGMDAAGFELDAGPGAKDLDLLDILDCPEADDPPAAPAPELTVAESPVVKADAESSAVATSSQDAASIMPAAVFEGMPQHYGPMFHQDQQHLYQPVPEMFGLSCSMHQPMPVVPPQFLPPVSADDPAESNPMTKGGQKTTKEGTRGRRSHQKSAEEVMMQEERVKKRRRESAQRSRARKNCYVKNLEYENRSLKAEVEKLRALLSQVDSSLRTAGSSPPVSLVPAVQHTMTAEVDGYSAAA